MTIIQNAITAVEKVNLPDWLTLSGVEFLVGRTKRKLARTEDQEEDAFAKAMRNFPIAVHTEEANEQHYELPAEFFALCLGPQKKYSCCLYDGAQTTLAEAETLALTETVEHADLKDGQSILELGCGWGSLSLFMAKRFPNARVVSVSNSASQRAFIEEKARAEGITNLQVRTANMVDFEPGDTFDRIVSVEMFEHMSNWPGLLERTRNWLNPEGKLFLHVFTHKNRSYRFDHEDKADWIAQHFFTGGIMPAHDLLRRFPDLYQVEEEWRWSGQHYEKTAHDWLENFDRNIDAIRPILKSVYGNNAETWERRWRLFFLATAGLFGHDKGQVWGVSHYRLTPA
ncbi:cyclopropane-fatty-acyl-phospholipid synthase family protein [Rhizobium sp. L1K21]|uniref:SAM-dependent methyltransferase n=1 Tax=Rhizobium sp. L1K21 TaxID=2954933 RepID=UPI00209312DA|nr:cyclopropane-fatty-acyl-phospholipid synthase family protein [Rhizobium sp. L1K21]MCO6185265.1 cyclopropane-fatty-acyl-phospholipid synthase family protein [Rhizobium sp. L1K21]